MVSLYTYFVKKEFLNYFSFGLLVKLLNIFILYIIYYLFHDLNFSGVVSFLISTVILIFLNSRFVFNSTINFVLIFKYIISIILTLIIYLLFLNIAFSFLPNIIIAGITASLFNYPIHFLINRNFVFVKSKKSKNIFTID